MQVMALLIYYLGVDKRQDNLLHHNLSLMKTLSSLAQTYTASPMAGKTVVLRMCHRRRMLRLRQG